MNNYKQYQSAADDLNRYGWVRGWGSPDDSRCLISSLHWADHHNYYRIPTYFYQNYPEVILEVDAKLCKMSRHYRRRSARIHKNYSGDRRLARLQTLMVRWNDSPWRQKKDVLRLLNSLAQEKKMEWMEDENLRLSIECSTLREQIADLKLKLASLEQENASLWTRLNVFKPSTLELDRIQLESLEAELNEKWNQLQEVVPV